MLHPRHRPQPLGFALLIVLTTIVMMTTLSAFTMFKLSQGSETAHSILLHQQAQTSAQHQLMSALASLNPASLLASPVGSVSTITTAGNNTQSSVVVTKTQPATLWMVSTSTVAVGSRQARHKVATSAHIIADSTAESALAIRPIPRHGWLDLF